MIDNIKNIIKENKEELGLNDFSFEEIKVSKFFHGAPSYSTKVIFFISYQNKPICLIKVVRNSEENDLIEREIDGIKHFNFVGLKTPKILGSGKIDNLKYVCQEILPGQPAGKNKEIMIFSKVANYHKSVVKTKKIKIKEILEPIKTLSFPPDTEMSQTLEELSLKKDNEIYIASQHGDLTYKNLIINSGGEISFIDFENFGLRSVWGIDITHYMSRMTDANNVKRSSFDTASYFVSASKKYRNKYDLGISDEECFDLFLLNLLFEILKKNFFHMRKDIIPMMKNIWLK